MEPATGGRVLIHSSLGPIEVELWTRESPLACKNFLTLALEGYYDGTLFHRISKDFALQGGDREHGDGTGGTSIFADPKKEFPNELNSRLRFTARGILATTGDTGQGNSSQFFITLAQNVHIERSKHTIFGRVVGETIYNVAKANEFQVEPETERPLFPPTIDRIEVLENPFPDVRPRDGVSWHKAEESDGPKRQKRGLRRKNVNLMSFGEEGEEDLVGGLEGGNTLTMMSSVVSAPAEKKAKRSHDGKKQSKLLADDSTQKAVDAIAAPFEKLSEDDMDRDEGEDADERKEKTKKDKKKDKKKKDKKKKDKKTKKQKPLSMSLGLKPLALKTVSVDYEADRSKEIQDYNAKKLKLAQMRASKASQKETAEKFDAFRKQLAK